MLRINLTIDSHRYHEIPGLQHFSITFDPMKSISWQRTVIPGMIRTLAGNCATILDCFQNDWKTAVETTSEEMVMGAVWALCEFSRLVTQQNDSDLSLTALDDAQKRFHRKKGSFQEQTMLKSAKAQVDEQSAREFHQLGEQKINTICAAMGVQIYRAENVTTTKHWQFQVRLNRARQVATTWSYAHWQSAK